MDQQLQADGTWAYAREQIKELQTAKEMAGVICIAAGQLFKAVKDDDSVLARTGIAGLLDTQNLNILEKSLPAVGFLIDPVRLRVTVPGIPPTTTRSAWGSLESYSAHQGALILGIALSQFLTGKLTKLLPAVDVASDSAVAAHELVKGHWAMIRRELAEVAHFDAEAILDSLCLESRAAMESCNAKQAPAAAHDSPAASPVGPPTTDPEPQAKSKLTLPKADTANGQTDRGPDRGKQILPDNPDVADLCKWLSRDLPKGKQQIEIAMSFTRENRRKAESLLRQARRYKHLWPQPDRRTGNGQ